MHVQLLHQHRLQPRCLEISEAFQFGRGNPVQARQRAYLPSILGSEIILLAASVVDANIPFLASNTLLDTLQTIIDLPQQSITFMALGVSVPIEKVAGHLTVSISNFPVGVHGHLAWKDLSHEQLWNPPHAEVIMTSELSRIKPPSEAISSGHALSDTSGMDPGLEEAGLQPHLSGAHHVAINEPSGDSRPLSTSMADSARPCGGGAGHPGARRHQEEGPSGFKGVPASRLEALRQSPRKLRPVPLVPSQDQVEPSKVSMGAKAFPNIFLAGAFLFKQLSATSTSADWFTGTGNGEAQGPASSSIFSHSFDTIFDSFDAAGPHSNSHPGSGPAGGAQSRLSAATPIDFNTGHDLRLTDHRRRCASIIGHLRPLLLLLSIHCTP